MLSGLRQTTVHKRRWQVNGVVLVMIHWLVSKFACPMSVQIHFEVILYLKDFHKLSRNWIYVENYKMNFREKISRKLSEKIQFPGRKTFQSKVLKHAKLYLNSNLTWPILLKLLVSHSKPSIGLHCRARFNDPCANRDEIWHLPKPHVRKHCQNKEL